MDDRASFTMRYRTTIFLCGNFGRGFRSWCVRSFDGGLRWNMSTLMDMGDHGWAPNTYPTSATT